MMKNIREKSGHYLIEASIILPLILMGILSIGYINKIVAIRENIVSTVIDELRVVMVYSSFDKSEVFLEDKLEKRIREENHELEYINIKKNKSKHTSGQFDNLISLELKYKIKINLPLPFINDVIKEEKFLCRKFVGDIKSKDNFEFADMEKSESIDIVYIFPIDGKRYHKMNCSYVEPKIIKRVLTEKLKVQYYDCEICDTKSSKNGEIVYLFPDYGNAYHKIECNTVKKNIISIEINMAEDRGYTQCMKCGG